MKRWVIRVRVEGAVGWVPLEALLEERGVSYRGFEHWKQGAFSAVTKERLLEVQKDLRLWVKLPTEEAKSCDLAGRQEEITEDWFAVGTWRLEEGEVWGCDAEGQESRIVPKEGWEEEERVAEEQLF